MDFFSNVRSRSQWDSNEGIQRRTLKWKWTFNMHNITNKNSQIVLLSHSLYVWNEIRFFIHEEISSIHTRILIYLKENEKSRSSDSKTQILNFYQRVAYQIQGIRVGKYVTVNIKQTYVQPYKKTRDPFPFSLHPINSDPQAKRVKSFPLSSEMVRSERTFPETKMTICWPILM